MIPNLRYHGNPNVKRSATTHKNSILAMCYFSSVKVYLSNIFNVLKIDIRIQHI